VADAVRVRGLNATFPDGTVALDHLDLTVAPGEIVAVVGPSGCGKSTLLRVVSGLATSTAGSVEVQRDALAYVFQDPTLLPWLDALRNVELPLRLAGVPRPERRERAARALQLVGLGEAADKLPRALSGGMRMRVSVARSMVARPTLFLLDEPFAAVDELTRHALGDLLLDLHERAGFAALLVTHSVAEAVYLADRVLVMTPRPGRIASETSINLPRPRTPEMRWSSEFAVHAATITSALRDLATVR